MARISRPIDADEAISAVGIEPEVLAPQHKPGPPRPFESFQGAGLVLTVATADEGLRLNRIEAQGRRWAGSLGVASPEVVAAADDGAWLLARWLDSTRPQGPEYVTAALATADQIMAAAAPHLDDTSSEWVGPRTGRWQRAARLIAGGFPVTRWNTAKQSAAALTDRRTAHGDFYFRNAMWTGAEVSVIDWEFVGTAPAYTDHLRLWSTLHAPADRSLALHTLLDNTDAETWSHICTLAQWLSLRLFGENLSAPKWQRNERDLTHARVVAKEGLALGAAATSPGEFP